MSSVVLFIHDYGKEKAAAIAVLRKELALSLSVLSSADISKSPLVENRLFDRHDPGFPAALLSSIATLEQLEVSYTLHEVPEGQSFSSRGTYFNLNSRVLKNMIESRSASLEQQRGIGSVEDGVE